MTKRSDKSNQEESYFRLICALVSCLLAGAGLHSLYIQPDPKVSYESVEVKEYYGEWLRVKIDNKIYMRQSYLTMSNNIRNVWFYDTGEECNIIMDTLLEQKFDNALEQHRKNGIREAARGGTEK